MSCLLKDAVNLYDLSCDVAVCGRRLLWRQISRQARHLRSLLTRACPGPERARNRLKCLRVFLHSKVCREEWHDVATPPLFRLAEYGKFFLV